MGAFYLPAIDRKAVAEAITKGAEQTFIDLLVTPLHEELYRRQSFDLLEELTEGQQLLLCFDYVAAQVKSGGFIQLLHNGYAGLLPDLPELLLAVGAAAMSLIIDDALVFYVQHREQLEATLSVQEFAQLYHELPDAERLDNRFHEHYQATISALVHYAQNNLQEFMSV